MLKRGPRTADTPGGAGQNARLAAKLTGFKIDIKPASNPEGDLTEEAEAEPAAEAADEETGEA